MCKPFYILVISISVYSCSETSIRTSPQDVIKKNERLVLEMKADSIAQLFTTGAELGMKISLPLEEGILFILFFLRSRTYTPSIIMTRWFRAP